MNALNPNEFATTRLGLRFAAQETEHRYRQWQRKVALPFQRFGFIATTSSWIGGMVAANVWARDWFSQVTPPWTAVAIIFVMMTAATFTRTAVLWTLEATTLAQIVAGCTLVLSFANFGDHFGLAVLTGCYVASYPAFMRMPPGTVVLAVGPYIGLMLWIVLGAYSAGQINALEAVTYALVPLLTILTAVVVCAVIDRISRQTFVNDLIIQRQGSLIRRYVPPAVAKSIEDGQESSIDRPQRRRVTVLFSDIVGFTHMADRLDAESLTQILNEYMAAMADLVEQHGGTLNEFSGDGLMAVFGAPDAMTPEDQAMNAVHAAQAMQAQLPSLNEQWLKLGIGEPLQIRIGINTGVLSVGSFGSAGRMTYTAIGLQTNIASRIQSHCQPGGVLLSDASWHLVKNRIDCEPRGEVECKGVHFPVKVYAPSST